MSLMKCCECNTKVSEYAEKCPNCGCPISVIKEKSNKYIITFIDGYTIDLTGLEDKITEDMLGTRAKLGEILKNDYNADGVHGYLIIQMFKFNKYKFPDNYQELYDAMCEYNQKRVEAMDADKLKCPACGSINIGPLSTYARLLGVFSMGRARYSWVTFECKHCRYMW